MAAPSNEEKSAADESLKSNVTHTSPPTLTTLNSELLDFGDAPIAPEQYGSGPHIFKTPQIAEYWLDIYNHAKYEGRHRFDPQFTWTAAEERQVVRKVCS